MHKVWFLALIASFSLLGCRLLVPENPIVGSWENTAWSVSTLYVFRSDGTSTEIARVLGVEVATHGIWNADTTSLTCSWNSSPDDETIFYSFNGDKSEMILVSDGEGIERTFIRL